MIKRDVSLFRRSLWDLSMSFFRKFLWILPNTKEYREGCMRFFRGGGEAMVDSSLQDNLALLLLLSAKAGSIQTFKYVSTSHTGNQS